MINAAIGIIDFYSYLCVNFFNNWRIMSESIISTLVTVRVNLSPAKYVADPIMTFTTSNPGEWEDRP